MQVLQHADVIWAGAHIKRQAPRHGGTDRMEPQTEIEDGFAAIHPMPAIGT